MDVDRIFLTGFMGAGKSTVGKLLADKIGYRFYDVDRMLVKGFGKTVSRIFNENGEHAFRKAETQVLQELCKRSCVMISTGGGTLARPENMDMALAHGTVIYLFAPVEELYERVIFSPKDRPILEEPDTEGVFREKFAAREATYKRAHLSFGVSGKQPANVVDDVLAVLAPLLSASSTRQEAGSS